jgi:hypothetical protein
MALSPSERMNRKLNLTRSVRASHRFERGQKTQKKLNADHNPKEDFSALTSQCSIFGSQDAGNFTFPSRKKISERNLEPAPAAAE